MSETDTLDAQAVIKDPSLDNRPQSEKYYCTETEWREFTTLTNQSDFPSSMILQCLSDATEQVKKDAFYLVQKELVTKDSEDRYFTARRYWGNGYGKENLAVNINHNQVTKYDIDVWEAENIGVSLPVVYAVGASRSQIVTRIPYSAITEIDPINCYFKLSSDYPTSSSKQILVSYNVSGKMLEDVLYELKRACIEMTTILAYKKLKTKRLKKGTVSYTLGKQTVQRDEKTFDDLVKSHYDDYHSWINWIRPFIGRRVRVGRMETTRRNFITGMY